MAHHCYFEFYRERGISRKIMFKKAGAEIINQSQELIRFGK